MEIAALQSSSQSPETGEWEPVEKALVEMVKKRQMKVERLEAELDALRAHRTFLLESFSVPTFPRGYDPVTERIGVAVVGSENENDAVKTGSQNGSGSRQRQAPSSRTRNEVESGDGSDEIEEVVHLRTVRKYIPTETLSSSTSASNSKEARNVMDWAHDTDIDRLKDEIRRERPGVKSPRKSPAKPNGIATRISEKKLETGPSVNDDSESSDEISSSDEGSASRSEESDDSKLDSRSKSCKAKPSDSDNEEVSSQGISSSSASEISTKQKPSPVKIKRALSGEKANTTWKPKTWKAPSSSSEYSGESSSSSDEDTGRNSRHAHVAGAPVGRAREPKAPKAVSTVSLSSDASPEDLFDWTILGLKGPWLPQASVDKSSGGSELNVQSSLPLKFPSMADYTAMFQKLIGEEAKAILLSEWEQFKAGQDLNTEAMTQSPNVDSRGQSSVWQPRSMVQTMGDPFHYFEAEWIEGPNLKFDGGEFLCMIVPRTEVVKAFAIVHHQDRYQAPLLRTRAPWDSSLDKCVLLRLCNMVTLRRMFLAVSTLSEIFSPFQQQILDPLSSTTLPKPPPAAEEAVGGDLKLKLSSECLRNFSDRKILNTLQLQTVSCLLHMRQGFQLVQGPPGTGKTSTIVGMVSTLLNEEPGVRILVCAPSNAALDEVAARLMHRMLDKSGNTYSPMVGTIVRFGSKRVMHPLVQLISLDNLTLRLSSSSHRSRSWVDILDGASVICATLSGCGNTIFDELERMFDVVIIDEAAQAVEAEVIIALRKVRGGTAYGRSIFERFQVGGFPVCMLTTQYRMHPSICLYPSRQFYGGALRDSIRASSMESIFNEDVCGRGITVRGCRFKLGHYCFMDVGWGTEREELVGHSRANYEEALVVCNVVQGVVKGLLSGLKPNVGVITPYIAQRGVIEGQLERRGIDTTACEVNTVDGFQGREKDVIVLSCVRAMADQGLGFVSDEKRMNVALTRAKYSLIIVGHAETLQKWSSAWGSLIDDARNRGYYQVLSNRKNPDVSPRNWKQSPRPRKDLSGMVEVEKTSQDSRKRSLNSTDGGRSQKRTEFSKSTAADTKSVKNVNGKEDGGKAREGAEFTEKANRNSNRAGVEEKVDRNSKLKRKREAAEGGKRTSVGLENSPKIVPVKKKTRNEVKKAGFITGPVLALPATSLFRTVGDSEKKKTKNSAKEEGFLESPMLKKLKKVKVELDVIEPLATDGPQKKLKEVKQEFPTVKSRKTKAVKDFDALSRKAKQSASSLGSPITNLKKPKEEMPESLPTSPTERKVGAASLPLEIPAVKEEEVSSLVSGKVHTRWSSPDAEEFVKTKIPEETLAHPIPPATENWRSMETPRQSSRGWFPNFPSKNDKYSPHNRQPSQLSVYSSYPASSTQGFANFDDVASRQQHWGNSYEVAADPHIPSRAYELDMSTEKSSSGLTRGSNRFGMYSNNRGNFQHEAKNYRQHSSSLYTPPHRNQFSRHQYPSSDYEQRTWTPRQTHSAPFRNKCSEFTGCC